jgi:hypothetical protein
MSFMKLVRIYDIPIAFIRLHRLSRRPPMNAALMTISNVRIGRSTI